MRMVKMGEKGASLVEAAITLPVLIFMMVVIAQVGVLVNAKLVAGEAAREAAREYATYALEREGLCGEGLARAIARAEAVASSLPYPGGFNAADPAHFSLEPGGSRVTVTVSCRCPVFVPGIGRLVSSNSVLGQGAILITGSATFHKELREVLE